MQNDLTSDYITQTLTAFMQTVSCKNKYILLLDAIPADTIKMMENLMKFTFDEDEKPIVFVNPNSKIFIDYTSWFYMTNKRIIFSIYKKDKWAGLLRPDIISWLPFKQISSITINPKIIVPFTPSGYIGHEFFINSIPFGLLNVGRMYDACEIILYLNDLFLFAQEEGFFLDELSDTKLIEQVKLNNISLPRGILSKIYLMFWSITYPILITMGVIGILLNLIRFLGCKTN